MTGMTWRPASIVPIWVAAVAAIAAIVFLVPREQYAMFLSLTLGVAVLLVFAAQLVLQQKDGLVARVTIAVTGCVLLLGGASAVLLPLQFAAA